jgi:hypothetical protein
MSENDDTAARTNDKTSDEDKRQQEQSTRWQVQT